MSSSRTPFEFTFRCPVPQAGSFNTLCEDCAELDLEQSFTNAFHLYEGTRRGKFDRPNGSFRKGNGPAYLKDFHYVCSLGNRLSRKTNCKLCIFLAQMTEDPSKGSYKLLAFCSSESYLFEPRKKDVHGHLIRRPWEKVQVNQNRDDGSLVTTTPVTVEHNIFMAVVPEIPGIPRTGVPLRWFETGLPNNGSIYRLSAPEADVSRLTLPREFRPEANFTLMRGWLGRCRCKHDTCGPQKPIGASLPGFRVINCWKKGPDGEHQVIEAKPWSERYVALSYVWGPPSGDWPQTILDAVEVTKRLGERYLWVDRLCIDQTNVKEMEFLFNKMGDIYAGAGFTIVCAAGDARTGIPGVNGTVRNPQPRVELNQRSERSKGKSAVRSAPDPIRDVIGITEEEYATDVVGETGWLDTLRFGLRGEMEMDFGGFSEDERRMKEYDIPYGHLRYYQDFAEDFGYGVHVDDFLDKMKELARRMGISMKELVPYFKRENAEEEGWDPDKAINMPISERPFTDSSKPERPLPPSKADGKLILVSTMQEPRTTIRNSEWATRGWTYQEGVLSNRRLVFTEQQTYWECRGMAVCESVDLPLNVVDDQSGKRMADYMLSGIFDDDLHRTAELQYGFQPSSSADVGEQVLALDGHIHAFTSRNLTNPSDSLRAFLGIVARYRSDAGLLLLLGIPVWAGAFADGKPGLQHTFALSISSWTHIATPTEQGSEMYVADCPRRRQLPSWTWAGWQGAVEFCNEKHSKFHRKTESTNGLVGIIKVIPEGVGLPCGDDIYDVPPADPLHSDFFKVLTNTAWVGSIDKIWSAEMVFHDVDGTQATLLSGWAPVWTTGDPNKSWLLTIQKPRVLRHMHFMHPTAKGEWRRLMGKVVKVHLSVLLTEAELMAGHKDGKLVTVLVFAGTVPYVWNGIARFLVLRREDDDGMRWERIGRLNMFFTEGDMGGYADVEELISALPVKAFGRDITIV